MRIIAGTAGGRTLVAPKGLNTRPTQDYVRESLFNIIRRDVTGANVLDLFAGSGALGLEAISRGAEHAVFSDQARQAVDCIRRNAEAMGFLQQVKVIRGDWRSILQKLEKQEFDLVFLDPPYRLTRYRDITNLLAEKLLLSSNALIIIEHRKDVIIELSPLFTLQDTRIYGDTGMHFYRYAAGGNDFGQ